MGAQKRTLRVLMVLVLLIVGVLAVGAAPAAAVDTGNIAVFKSMCNQIGQSDTCSTQKDTSLKGYKVDFKVYAGTATSGTAVQTITVTLNLGDGYMGRTDGPSLATGTYTVCEVPTAYKTGQANVALDAYPRPNLSTGGVNQSANGPLCITTEVNKGTAEVKFLDKKVVPPTATPVPPTATPVPPTATSTPTSTETPEKATKTPVATKTPEKATKTPTKTPVATSTPDADELPKTGGPQDGSLAIFGLVLAIGGAVAYRIARVRRPADVRTGSNNTDSDAK